MSQQGHRNIGQSQIDDIEPKGGWKHRNGHRATHEKDDSCCKRNPFSVGFAYQRRQQCRHQCAQRVGQKRHQEMLGFKQMNALLQACHGFNICTGRTWNDIRADIDKGHVDVSAHNQTEDGPHHISPNGSV
ncbi:MAG: hypothetical protein RL285_1778 [Bacteroidota bacterium]